MFRAYWVTLVKSPKQISYTILIHCKEKNKYVFPLFFFKVIQEFGLRTKENRHDCDNNSIIYRLGKQSQQDESFIRYDWMRTSPAIVLRNMRYSKLEISLLCQRWVMLDDLNSWRGVAKEIRLVQTHTHALWNALFFLNNPFQRSAMNQLHPPGLW